MTNPMNTASLEVEWLVEIRLRDWVPTPEIQGRTIAYEEVLARDEIAARQLGFDQFEARCKYEPILRRHMAAMHLTPSQCCAPEAVAI